MKKKIVLTGGAGFIGSCMLRTLNDAGVTDVYVVDHIASTEKWKNLENKQYIEYIHKDIFLERLDAGEFKDVDAVIHLGACSSTTETDFDYLWNNNVNYSKRLWQFTSDEQIPIIYASSAATYGDGREGFDDKKDINLLRPLNGYGYSKQVFDQWTMKQDNKPTQHVGLKFFNVYGPNEYCKGTMASMVYHGYKQIVADGEIRLFKSYNKSYQDGGQLRDFVYVKDVCKAIMFFLEHSEVSGLFNIGTGKAHSFEELATAVFDALGLKANIKYIDMPEHLKEKYQYYTEADMSLLRDKGYTEEFSSVKTGVADYVKNYLSKGFEVY